MRVSILLLCTVVCAGASHARVGGRVSARGAAGGPKAAISPAGASWDELSKLSFVVNVGLFAHAASQALDAFPQEGPQAVEALVRSLELPDSAVVDRAGGIKPVLEPVDAAKQVLGEALGRRRLPEKIGRLFAEVPERPGEKEAVIELDSLQRRIDAMKRPERVRLLRALANARKRLLGGGVDSADRKRWTENHVNAVFDGARRLTLIPDGS